MSTQLQTPEAIRQSTNYIYRNAAEQVTIEWVTDDPAQADAGETALTLFELALDHKSDIPESIKNFRQAAR